MSQVAFDLHLPVSQQVKLLAQLDVFGGASQVGASLGCFSHSLPDVLVFGKVVIHLVADVTAVWLDVRLPNQAAAGCVPPVANRFPVQFVGWRHNCVLVGQLHIVLVRGHRRGPLARCTVQSGFIQPCVVHRVVEQVEGDPVTVLVLVHARCNRVGAPPITQLVGKVTYPHPTIIIVGLLGHCR